MMGYRGPVRSTRQSCGENLWAKITELRNKGDGSFMLTNEKVLEVFKDYLSQDPDYEVVMASHGYTVMGWDNGLTIFIGFSPKGVSNSI